MSIETLTLKELVELSSLLNDNGKPDDSHWEIGRNYFIRTVTFHFVGKLEKVTSQEIVMSSCSWIADSGRFSAAMNGTEFSEIEPYKTKTKVIIGRGAIVDASIYDYELPKKQK